MESKAEQSLDFLSTKEIFDGIENYLARLPKNKPRVPVLYIGNYQSVQKLQIIELNKITMLFGPNSVGKSVVVDALKDLANALTGGDVDVSRLNWGMLSMEHDLPEYGGDRMVIGMGGIPAEWELVRLDYDELTHLNSNILDQQWRNDIPLVYEGLQNVWDVALLWDSDGTIRCSGFWQDNKQQARFYSGGSQGTPENRYAPIFYGGEALASYIEKLTYNRNDLNQEPFLDEVLDGEPIYDGFNVVATREKLSGKSIDSNSRYKAVVLGLLNAIIQEPKVRKLVSVLDFPEPHDNYIGTDWYSLFTKLDVFFVERVLRDCDAEDIELDSIRKFYRFQKLCDIADNKVGRKFSKYHFENTYGDFWDLNMIPGERSYNEYLLPEEEAFVQYFLLLQSTMLARSIKQIACLGPLREIPKKEALYFGPIAVGLEELSSAHYRLFPDDQPNVRHCDFSSFKNYTQQHTNDGLAYWYYLAQDCVRSFSLDEESKDPLLSEVNRWLNEKFNTGFTISAAKNIQLRTESLQFPLSQSLTSYVDDREYDISVQLSLHSEKFDQEVYPNDVGVGVSQFIPVLIAILKEPKLFIEQPELHLHPALQLVISDLIISRINKFRAGDFVITETHSEHIVLRLLRRIREYSEDKIKNKELRISSNEVSVYYVMATNKGTVFKKIRVSDDGDFIDRWPSGFFNERDEELF